MQVVLAAGGTAGHINPAMAVAQALQAEGVTVWFAGTPDSMEERLAGLAGLEFVGFPAQGLNRRKPWTAPATAVKLASGRSAAKRWLRGLKPQAVATFGGYASLPVGLAASALKLPLLVHEQNARPGLANRVLAGRADCLAISDQRALAGFKSRARTVLTGNPLRAELFGVSPAEARVRLGFDEEACLLLVFGGSLGARHINTAVVGLADRLMAARSDLSVLQLTGQYDYDWVVQELASLGIPPDRWQVMAYCQNMADAYAAADLVLSRAGATSLAELTALGKAALLVPYPYAVADEQTANAERLADAGAAAVWPDLDLASPGFAELLVGLIEDDGRRHKMAAAAAGLGRPKATEAVTRLILDLAQQST